MNFDYTNITFKIHGYHKNYDFSTEDENIITEYDGNVSELRIPQRKPPFVIGEYGISVWNIELGKILNVDFDTLISKYSVDDTYDELMRIINEKLIDINKYKKIIFVHSFILRAEYRKLGITEEFIEFIYRNFYDENSAIIAMVKPFQNNPIDKDYYYKRKSIQVIKSMDFLDRLDEIPAFEYYSLNDLYNKEDTEINEYKLFAVANKCGFKRISETHLFFFSPEKIQNKMIEKIKMYKELKK